MVFIAICYLYSVYLQYVISQKNLFGSLQSAVISCCAHLEHSKNH